MSSTFEHIKGEIIMTAEFVGKPGVGAELANWAHRLKEFAKAHEPGILEYSFGRRGDTIVVWEKYAGVEVLKQHIASDLMTEFRGTDLLAETPEYRFYENLDSNQGISFP